MPVYEYKHTCGWSKRQFMQADKDHLILKCDRCGRGVVARKDSSAKVMPVVDGMRGVKRG